MSKILLVFGIVSILVPVVVFPSIDIWTVGIDNMNGSQYVTMDYLSFALALLLGSIAAKMQGW